MSTLLKIRQLIETHTFQAIEFKIQANAVKKMQYTYNSYTLTIEFSSYNSLQVNSENIQKIAAFFPDEFKILTIDCEIEEKTLTRVLEMPALLHLKALSFKGEFSTSFYEESLTPYMLINSAICSLCISDSNKMADKDLTQLKNTIINHPTLDHFRSNLSLSSDSELHKALGKKEKQSCRTKRQKEKAELEEKMNIIFEELSDLKALIPGSYYGYRDYSYLRSLLWQSNPHTLPKYHMLDRLNTVIVELECLKKHLANTNDALKEKAWAQTFEKVTLLKLVKEIEQTDVKASADLLNHLEQQRLEISDLVADVRATKPSAYYYDFAINSNNLFETARKILLDYTKNDSGWVRFFTGHWNRHHVIEVNKLIERMNPKHANPINTVQELITVSRNICLENAAGSLAKRMKVIRELAKKEVALEPQEPSLQLEVKL